MEKPKLSATLVKDRLAVAQARRSLRGIVLEMPTLSGTLLVVHENPQRSYCPQGRELRDAARKLKPEIFKSKGDVIREAGPARCAALTAKGTRCKRNVIEGSEFCSTHQE